MSPLFIQIIMSTIVLLVVATLATGAFKRFTLGKTLRIVMWSWSHSPRYTLTHHYEDDHPEDHA
jgi:hypothetical protein